MADKNFVEARDKCLSSVGLKIEDLRKFEGDEISEDLMCFGKCMQEEQGLLDGDGNVVEENFEKLPILESLSEDEKTKIWDCLKEVGKVETCQDFGKQRECVHKNL